MAGLAPQNNYTLLAAARRPANDFRESGKKGEFCEVGRPVGRWVNAKTYFYYDYAIGGRNDADSQRPGATNAGAKCTTGSGNEGCASSSYRRTESSSGKDWNGGKAKNSSPACA